MDKEISYCAVCGCPDDECICYEGENTNTDSTYTQDFDEFSDADPGL